MGSIIQLVVVVALAAASYALKPKLGRNSNGYGRYGFDALLTKTDPQIPLPTNLAAWSWRAILLINHCWIKTWWQNLGATATAQKINKVVSVMLRANLSRSPARMR
jgi:hypothetical protein